jgi:hypothetical protein
MKMTLSPVSLCTYKYGLYTNQGEQASTPNEPSYLLSHLSQNEVRLLRKAICVCLYLLLAIIQTNPYTIKPIREERNR